MSKQSASLSSLPPEVAKALRDLGANLALSRQRRRETQQAWARRLGVSVPTLIRLEKGDPGVAMGSYATALWLIGRAAALPDAADPSLDRGALEFSIREAKQRSVRTPLSIDQRLSSPAGARRPGSEGTGSERSGARQLGSEGPGAQPTGSPRPRSPAPGLQKRRKPAAGRRRSA